jgi:(p)ppGpp synthase/HD superfamily hydrolase
LDQYNIQFFKQSEIMFNPDLYHKALEFVAKAHLKQHMPGQELPYLLHLTQVCGEVIHALTQDHEGLNTDLAIQVALLHDCIEDTEISYEQIEKEFGETVAKAVLALTKDDNLPKPDQMADSLDRILKQTAEIRIVKMADRIVNLQEPPYFWKPEKRRKYQEEARKILAKLQGVHPFVEARLQERIDNYSNYIQS